MTPIPLAELRLWPKHHLSALWWLGLLYRRPGQLTAVLEQTERWAQVNTGLRLAGHAAPYQVFLIALTRFFCFGEILPQADQMRLASVALWLAVWAAVGVGFSAVIGGELPKGADLHAFFMATGIPGNVALGIALFGTSWEVAVVSTIGTAFGIAGGVAAGVGRGLAGRGATGITRGSIGGSAVMIAVGLIVGNASGEGLAAGVSAGVAFAISTTRVFYLPIHLPLVWPQPRPSSYTCHPVAWDDLCGPRFPGLHRLLVVYSEKQPEAGAAEIERLIDAYPTQRVEALKAKTILLARESGKCKTLARVSGISAQLPEGEKGFLSQTPELKSKISEIAAIQARLDAMDRPFLRGPTSQNLVEKIETFRDQISGFREPLASEYRAAAKSWLQVAIEQRDHARNVLEREPTAQVFRAGDPVDRDREAFVPRIPIFEKLEAQVMLATGCPGLLLYGRRRMGKSTVLKNLPGFLPPNVRVVSVSMQNPEASGSHALFARHVVEAIRKTISDGNGHETPEDLPSLYRFFNGLNSRLEERAERFLLGVDEFENIDRKIQEGVFTEDLLDTLRESMQGHRQITWVFSGSHSIDELDGAEWASYLVSARTVEVPPFTFEETRLLLTEPLKHSRLWDKDDPARPRFSPEMWGEGGIKRIQAETGGWPHLVQLVAETLVDRMNDAGKGHVDEELFERSLDAAVVAGDTVLSQLLRGESRVPGEWEYLLGFRERETQAPPEDDEVRRSLQRRLVVVKEGEGEEWRLRAPLFARWLRKRG